MSFYSIEKTFLFLFNELIELEEDHQKLFCRQIKLRFLKKELSMDFIQNDHSHLFLFLEIVRC